MIHQWQQDIINSKQKQYIYSVEWLDKDENVLDETIIDVISGSANFDGTRNNRRSASLTIKNLDKKYIPNPKGLLWINNKIRLKAGYMYGNNKKLMFNQGVYVLGNPQLLSKPAQKEVTINLLDKWTWLDGTIKGKLMNKTIVPVGTRIDSAIKLLLEIAGETKYVIDECDTLLPYSIEKSSMETIAKTIEEICFIVSYEAFYDQEGNFIFRKALKVEDYKSTPPSWNYTTNGLYLESNRELDWIKVKNYIKVVGDTLDDGILIQAIAKDESNSDMSITNIGLRDDLIEDSNIFKNEYAQDRADYELLKRIMIAERVTTQIIPNFSHVVGDIIEIVDKNNGCKGNYVLQSVSYPMSYNSTMTLGLWGIRDWR